MRRDGRLRSVFRGGCLSSALLLGLLAGGCDVEPVGNAPLDNYNPGDDTAARMYGSVAAEHAEENAEIRNDWEAGGEPLPKGGPYNPSWEYY